TNERVNPPADNSITSESVLVSTGMKPGKVSLPNNKTAQISGNTKTEIFNRNNVPGTTTYDFSIGAKSSELAKFWNDYTSSQRKADEKKKEDKKKEDAEKKKEKEEEKEKEKEKEDNSESDNKDEAEDSEEKP